MGGTEWCHKGKFSSRNLFTEKYIYREVENMKTSEVAMKNHKVRGSSIIPATQRPQRIVTSLFTCVVFY